MPIDAMVKGADAGDVLNGGAHRYRDEIASTLGWWAGAGLDTAIVETPNDWLAPPETRAAPPIAAAAPPPPADFETLCALIAIGAYVAAPPPPRRRIAPAGDPHAKLMIVTDCPDAADLAAKHLLAAESALFDAMLAAMGETRGSIWLAALAPGGRIGTDGKELTALVRAQLALIRPQALWVMGDETARVLLGVERMQAGDALRTFNHDGGSVATIATVHPRTLRLKPDCKSDCWRAMRLLLGVSAR